MRWGIIALCCFNNVCAQSLSEQLNKFNNRLDTLPQVYYVTTSAPVNEVHQTLLTNNISIWPNTSVDNHKDILEAITNKYYFKAGLLLAKIDVMYKKVMIPKEQENLLLAKASVEILLKNFAQAREYLIELSMLNDSPELLFKLWAVTCKAKALSEASDIFRKICINNNKFCQIAKEYRECN